MAKLDFAGFQKHLSAFDFPRLFVEVLGWNHAPTAERAWQEDGTTEHTFARRMVAELGGVAVLQVVPATGWPDEATRAHIWKHLSHRHVENIIIFTDRRERASQSLWYWVKRGKDEATGKLKNTPRRHEYFRGQPVDLFASKLQAMVVELSELDTAGRMPVLEAARRIQAALDVDKTTKRFFTSYSEQHEQLLGQIEGIDDERDRRWYASVILNRLMFVWFLQKKFFLDDGNVDYLQTKLVQSGQRGKDRFFGEFLSALFFDAFAKPEVDRSKEARALTGQVPYLNGGLFLHHKLELDEQHRPRLGTTLRIPDAAFEGVFNVFAAFTWHLDDTPGGDADEINPDVLGYIFEKYINQKAFGAYYTRPEITGYLAERSIHQLILERVYEPPLPELKLHEVKFDSVADLLAHMDARVALKLVNQVLPSITVLDPAVGSGAFLVAALKCLINVYYAIVGRAELGASAELQIWLKRIQKNHPSVGYYIKRRIVSDNLYGVDIMEEACEIAKLRLFLAMVSSVRRVEDLEPLPNIDFNILSGNSLVGLMRVDEHEFDEKNRQGDMFRKSFRQLLEEKNRKLDIYRSTAADLGKSTNLRELRDDIDDAMAEADIVMNELVQDQFNKRGIHYEQATWDANKNTLGKSKKRTIECADVAAQHPLHWGYVFDEIVQRRGGFDIVLGNPPWEVFKPQAKEFFADHSDLVTKKKMTIKEFEKEQAKLLKDSAVREAWLAYESRFPHMNQHFRLAPEYSHQFATVDGRKVGADLNLYKLFVERCFTLLRPGGHCGIVIPSGIYTDLGAKGLRDLLFEHTHIQGLFCFENRKEIFEGVHRSFKFVVLTFEKTSLPRLLATGENNTSAPPNDLLAPSQLGELGTTKFPAAFMRHDVADLERFPDEGALWLDVKLIKTLSPAAHAVMEFKSAVDVDIAHKMMKFPVLGERMNGTWNLKLHRELHMTDDEPLFKTRAEAGALPLVEGKMIHQFEFARQAFRYWVPEKSGRKSLIGRSADEGQILSYQRYRFAHRSIASSTNERSMIASILPPGVFSGNSLNVAFEPEGNGEQLFLLAFMNSFVLDYYLRQQVSANLNIFFIYQCPLPRLTTSDSRFSPIVQRAGRLICTTREFDDLAKTVGLKDHYATATEPGERARLRAELDGLVAHLYGLTEDEFAHILSNFPLVAEPVKQAARNAFRDVERGLVR
ncbi:MAG: ATP-binding protein [Burkholderiales bacterium]|nr:ATP-binding protein [Burkholderiales bacterium]